MDSFGGLFKFFYNIIPGSLFLLGLQYLNRHTFDLLPWSYPEKLFWIIVIGIFFGFIGQGIMKMLKQKGINQTIFEDIKSNTDNDVFKFVTDKVYFKVSAKKDMELKDIFYFMDNYLRNNSTMYIINDFSEKAAFWANISIGTAILFTVSLILSNPISIFLLVFLCFSLKLTYDYSYAEHDSVLKTYAQIKE